MTYEILLSDITAYIVLACWFGFLVAFLFKMRTPRDEGVDQKRNPGARLGIALEAVGFALVWFPRNRAAFVLGAGPVVSTVISLAAVLLAIASTVLVVMAVITLGKQWAVAARIIQNHELITRGPYSLVRNPIYSGMFGLLLATGVARGHWWALPPAAVIYWVGTRIRVDAEEKLLRETFGEKFEEYASRVPWLIPALFRSRRT